MSCGTIKKTLIFIVLLACAFFFHLLIIFPYLYEKSRTVVERFDDNKPNGIPKYTFDELNYINSSNIHENTSFYERELDNDLDNTDPDIVDELNNKFEYTPEKILENLHILKKVRKDEDYKELHPIIDEYFEKYIE